MKNIVYQIKNDKNEVLYIGCTTREAGIRFNEHLRKLKAGWHNNIKLQIEYNKSGGNVSFDIIDIVKKITTIEVELIKKLKPKCNGN